MAKAAAYGFLLANLRRRKDRIANAEARSADWLARGNQENEAGRTRTAERYYDNAQRWLDRANTLREQA